MELRHLRYFVAVVEEGSFTTAAEGRLHTSQPSLSRQIRDLEDEVGAELLSRSVHGVELTAAGKAFLDHARLALMQVDAAVEAAHRAGATGKEDVRHRLQTGHETNCRNVGGHGGHAAGVWAPDAGSRSWLLTVMQLWLKRRLQHRPQQDSTSACSLNMIARAVLDQVKSGPAARLASCGSGSSGSWSSLRWR